MRTTGRHLAIGLVIFAALGAAACNDDDQTNLCVGPGCPNYDGIAGRNSFANRSGSGAVGGSGLGGTGGVAPDASPDGSVPEAGTEDPAPLPEAGTDAPAPLEDCEIWFSRPIGVDAGSLTLGASDDADEEACGQTFTASVSVASNASSVNLFVNDNPLGLVAVLNGSAVFDAVLGNRGTTANTLRAEADMGDGRTCSVSFGGSVFVDCPGPSCSIELPVANDDGYLNFSQDDDTGTAGLQTQIVVSTEVEHTGQAVRIEIDEAFDVVPDQLVENTGANGTATFPAVTLVEGVRAVRAECRDAFDIVTLSPITEWNVDVTPCTLTIDAVAGGADPITPQSDLDSDMDNGLSVLLSGHITGDDCELVHVGDCDGTLTPIPISGQLGQDGSFSVPVQLGSETTRLDVCANVEDQAGNVSSPNAEIGVNVRTTSPAVSIAAPLTNARVNIAGGANVLADGEPSSSTCEVDVVVHCTEVGVNVQLFEDDVQISAQPCVAQADLPGAFLGQATFAALSLQTKDDGLSSTLRAQQSALGLPDGVSSDVLIQADCSAPSCAITGPDLSQNFLNAAADSSGLTGFQVSFQVSTEANSAGQNVRLTFDGDAGGSPSATAVLGGGSAIASFADVTLSEGEHSVQATCADPAGNVQASSSEDWTVDTTPCSSSLIVAGGASPVTPASDLDPVAADLQVNVTGQSVGADCTSVRVRFCADQPGSFSALGSGGSFSRPLTLASTTSSVSVCAELEDAAGNVGSSDASVNVRVDPPVVSFAEPADGSRFDLETGCSTTVIVSCTDVGLPVTLSIDGVPEVQTCLSGNVATFPVTFDTKNNGSLTVLTAQQTADGLPSLVPSISIQADCQAPVVEFTTPICDAQLALAGDDVEPGTPGLQIDASVTNGGVSDVTLTVTRGESTTDTPSTGDLVTTEFLSVDLGGPGSIILDACATDPQGNEGCATSCPLTIAAEPSINISNPAADPALITPLTPDCDLVAGGLQVAVSGTSDALDGSAVQVTLGLGATTTANVSGGVFSACVEALEGEPQTLVASVTDTSTGLSATDSISASVDLTAPGAMGTLTADVVGRREGTLDLSWESILDAGGGPLTTYRVRCATANILTEVDWAAATEIPLLEPSTALDPFGTPAPAPATTAGATETYGAAGFRVGITRFCMVRGEDEVGLLSALTPGNTTAVSNDFERQVFDTVTSTTSARFKVAPIGDVNGDGENDFIYGAENVGAQVFFGGPAFDTTPDIRITGLATGRFGSIVAGLGDINNDGIPDFAVAAPTLANGANATAGSVYVFFGRDGDTPWPALPISVAGSPGCGADICLHGTLAGAGFGTAVTSTDFDGSGSMDIVISAQAHNTRLGRVYVVLGGSRLSVPSDTILNMPDVNPDGFVLDPPGFDRFFGAAVTEVGTGSDGLGDLVIGAVGRASTSVPGAVFFMAGESYPGGSTGLIAPSASPLTQFATGTAGQFGSPVEAVGDFDGDGFGDVCVARNFEIGGHCNLYLGQAQGFAGAGSLAQFTNNLVDNDWAFFIANGLHSTFGEIGDLDGDGQSELALGSQSQPAGDPPLTPIPAKLVGTAELFYGGTAARTRAAADIHFLSADQGHMAPTFVGDIDGDGWNDLAVFDSDAGTGSRLTILY